MSKRSQQSGKGIDRRLLWALGIGVIILVAAGLALVLQEDSDTEGGPFDGSLASEVSVAEALELREQGAFFLMCANRQNGTTSISLARP